MVNLIAAVSRLEEREAQISQEIARAISGVDGVADDLATMARTIEQFSHRQDGCRRVPLT